MVSSLYSFRAPHPPNSDSIFDVSGAVAGRLHAPTPGSLTPERPPLRDLTFRPHHQIELLVVEEFICLTHDGQQMPRWPGKVDIESRWRGRRRVAQIHLVTTVISLL